MSKLHILSVQSLYNAMKQAIVSHNKEEFAWLINACKSQSSLAKLERKSLRVTSMSLNSFKLYCDNYIDGGFSLVDDLRRSLRCKAQPRGGSLAKIKRNKTKVQDLTERLEESERARAILIKAYRELNEIALEALSDNANTIHYNRHCQLYKDFFSLKMVLGDSDD